MSPLFPLPHYLVMLLLPLLTHTIIFFTIHYSLIIISSAYSKNSAVFLNFFVRVVFGDILLKNHDNDDQRMCGQSPLVIVAESQRTGPPVEKAMVSFVVVLSLLSFLSMLAQLNNDKNGKKEKNEQKVFSDQKHITPV